MGVFEMVVAVVGMACGTSVVLTILQTVQAALDKKPGRHSQQVAEEMKALREELRQLRSENSATILNLDSTLENLEQRLTRVELRGQAAETEYQRVGR